MVFSHWKWKIHFVYINFGMISRHDFVSSLARTDTSCNQQSRGVMASCTPPQLHSAASGERNQGCRLRIYASDPRFASRCHILRGAIRVDFPGRRMHTCIILIMLILAFVRCKMHRRERCVARAITIKHPSFAEWRRAPRVIYIHIRMHALLDFLWHSAREHVSGCWGSARDAVNRSFEVKSWLEIRGKSDDAGMKRRERVPPIRPQEECQSSLLMMIQCAHFFCFIIQWLHCWMRLSYFVQNKNLLHN